MATTTNYGWTTPDDTALVKDGASAIRTLGSSVDTTVKALNPGTTAGDLDYYTAATTKARIAKGTAGQVFTMNSGATAPEWAAAPAASFTSSTANTSTTQTTTSATYTDLATVTSVTLTTGTKALVIVTVAGNITSADPARLAIASYAVSGATTIAASDQQSVAFGQFNNAGIYTGQGSLVYFQTGLTAGSNTFTIKYKNSGGGATASFANRTITVVNMGS